MSKINNLINKGVPIDTPFLLSINVLKSFCSNQEKLETNISNEILKLGNFLTEIGVENYIYYSFAFQIIADQNSLEKNIYFSPKTIPLTLIYSLIPKKEQINLVDKLSNKEDDEVYSVIRQRIEKFRRLKKKNNLSKEEVLLREYPNLYKIYIENKKAIEYYTLLYDKLCSGKINEKKYIELVDEFSNSAPGIANAIGDIVKYYVETGIKKEYTVTKFCNDYADFFKKMVDSTDLFEEYFYNNPLTFDDIEIDKEKFELYLAIKNIISMSDANDKDKQRYVYYIANYFKENKDRKANVEPAIQIEELGPIFITPFSVYELYKKILIENPSIKPVTFSDVDFKGMSLSEVEVFIEEYLETFKANWEVIPLEEVERVGFKHEPRHTEDDIGRRIELFMEKKSFYADLDSFMCVKGKKTFDGYIGYIFSNGMVVLDKFYQNSKKGIVSKGDAIYYMKIEDFYRLSQFPKSILRKDSNVGYIEHRSGWQEKILKIINIEGNSFKTKEEITNLENKQLIKKNKKGD